MDVPDTDSMEKLLRAYEKHPYKSEKTMRAAITRDMRTQARKVVTDEEEWDPRKNDLVYVDDGSYSDYRASYRKDIVHFAGQIASSERYVISIDTKITRTNVFEFTSTMHLLAPTTSKLGDKNVIQASYISGFITEEGLFISYFYRPHLAGFADNYTTQEIAELTESGNADKHGSTHLCELLRRFVKAGQLTNNSAVRLRPVASIREAELPGQPNNESEEAQIKLVAYYFRLSFKPTGPKRLKRYDVMLETTVGDILAKCDDPVNSMQRVRFT